MSQSSSQQDVDSLFAAAHAQGDLSASAIQSFQLVDAGAHIGDALGVDVMDIGASEVFIATILIDDSGSMEVNVDPACAGHNEAMSALRASHHGQGILFGTRYMHGKVLNPYQLVEDAVKMSASNYRPGGQTPLYDFAVTGLGSVVAKTQELLANGIQVRTATLIITDGAENDSRKARASDVKAVVDSMLATERHIVAGMGIADGYTDFRQIFAEMGIRDNWVLTPGNNAHEIRLAMGTWSRSASSASQSAASFSQVSQSGLGGFVS